MPVVFNKGQGSANIPGVKLGGGGGVGVGVATGGHPGAVKASQPMGTVQTTVQPKDAKPLVEEKQVPAGPEIQVGENAASVGFSASRKWGDGNFGSTSVAVWVTLPCNPTYHEIEKTYETARDWVDGKMQEMLKGTPAA